MNPKSELEIRQLFKDNSDCYADTWTEGEAGRRKEGPVVQAMTEDGFIALLNKVVDTPTKNDPLRYYTTAGAIGEAVSHEFTYQGNLDDAKVDMQYFVSRHGHGCGWAQIKDRSTGIVLHTHDNKGTLDVRKD